MSCQIVICLHVRCERFLIVGDILGIQLQHSTLENFLLDALVLCAQRPLVINQSAEARDRLFLVREFILRASHHRTSPVGRIAVDTAPSILSTVTSRTREANLFNILEHL